MDEQDVVKILANKWLESGVEEGDILLLHSSIKRLLLKIKDDFNVIVSPQTIYDSLRKSLGEEGTLILPLFNFDFPKTKFFDVRNTPSHMGALSEIGRANKDAVRTGHPIYSFSIVGRYANEFINIDNYSGYGADSPFAKIRELNGKIAVIGLDDQNSMTSYHFVEEQNLVNYRYFKEFDGAYIDWDGNELPKKYALYVRDVDKGVQTDVNRMMDYFWDNGFYKGEKHNEEYGMRTIKFNDFYSEVNKVIKDGKAQEFLYSIKTD
ncbi:MAG: AAC(3) family N-acetyltransferase [Ginsengibacter sp.]